MTASASASHVTGQTRSRPQTSSTNTPAHTTTTVKQNGKRTHETSPTSTETPPENPDDIQGEPTTYSSSNQPVDDVNGCLNEGREVDVTQTASTQIPTPSSVGRGVWTTISDRIMGTWSHPQHMQEEIMLLRQEIQRLKHGDEILRKQEEAVQTHMAIYQHR
jgi:hypothetical protein